jgi:hypothetical protein
MVILPSLKAKALFSITFRYQYALWHLESILISIVLEQAFVVHLQTDKLNANTSIYMCLFICL